MSLETRNLENALHEFGWSQKRSEHRAALLAEIGAALLQVIEHLAEKEEQAK